MKCRIIISYQYYISNCSGNFRMNLRCRSRSSFYPRVLIILMFILVVENMILLILMGEKRQRQGAKTKLMLVSPNPLESPLEKSLKDASVKKRYHLIQEENKYFKKKSTKVNPFRTKIIIENSKICNQYTDMIIIIHSLHNYKDRRNAIRKTWGSIAMTSYNQRGFKNISLAFSFGKHKNETWNKKLFSESVEYKDIIQGDFGEDYSNLTYKSLFEIKWVIDQCQNVKYLLKTDDDMFMNIPHLINILSSHNMRRTIMGPYLPPGSKVYRKGKWSILKKVYPLNTWPEYEAGSSYVISSDLLRELHETAEYVTPIHVDDVYITGILGKIIGANHEKVPGFAYKYTKEPKVCDFVQNRVIAAHKMTPKKLLTMWNLIKKTPKSKCK